MSKRAKRKAAAKEKIPGVWIAAALAVVVGAALGVTVGRNFVFQFGEQYKHLALFAFLVLVPSIALLRLFINKGKLSSPGPKHSPLFTVLNWLVSNALIAAAIIFSPFGYLALFNQAFGDDAVIAAKVCCVRDMKQKYRSSCNRSASIVVNGREHWVCLADHYTPNTPLADQDVLLNIRQSSLGFSLGDLKLTRQYPPRLIYDNVAD